MADRHRPLTDLQLAQVGLERLRFPVPMVKLQVINAAAKALKDKTTSSAVWDALVQWIGEAQLESEVLEGLSILLVAEDCGTLPVYELRRAIARPSILSDHFVDLVLGTQPLIRTWEQCHSGEVPQLFQLDSAQQELSAGVIVAPILVNTLRKLERETDLPFVRQWAYEFERLNDVRGARGDGHLSFFGGNLGHDGTGYFIGWRSHMARSAYLRALALAVDHWGMPDEFALHYALFATPVDRSFLRMLPGDRPPWMSTELNLPDDSYEASANIVREILARCEGDADLQLVHFNGQLCRGQRLNADLEIISIKCSGDSYVADDFFRFHDWLPGQVFIDRDAQGNFCVEPWPIDQDVSNSKGSSMRPCLLPAISKHVGYVHADLISRMPYLPVCALPAHSFLGRPRFGGIEITLGDQLLGMLHYWNQQWQPMQYKKVGNHCSLAVTLDKAMTSALLTDADKDTVRCWRTTVWSRPNDYGDWNQQVHLGIVN
ncbi:MULTISPECIES: hypothetical protein [Burkholderia]|uniref:hypothetical protein n=1 Tax=Burkholderia TaxID=32008 RepID=UPI000F12EDA6|nr:MULTISPECIES: hypothetical protein [Burkholderia]VBG08353.1 Uncharacterised protein [Burkholderia pseudomallei]